MKAPPLADTVASLLVLLFGYTAFSKAFSHALFQTQLQLVMNRTGAAVAAFLIPTSEAVIVLLLLFPQTRLAGFYLSAFLLALFTVYLFYLLLTMPQLPCSCGGVISALSWPQHLVLNLLFLGLTALGIRRCQKVSSPPL